MNKMVNCSKCGHEYELELPEGLKEVTDICPVCKMMVPQTVIEEVKSDQSFMEGYGVDVNVAVEVGKLAKILVDKEREIAIATENLKNLEAEKLKLVTEVIPVIFKANSITSLGLEDGSTMSIDEKMSMALIKDEKRRALALAWLANNGGEDMIKSVLSIDDPNPALLETLNKGGVLYSMSKDVNTNSLKAWFREKLGLKEGYIATLDKADVPKEFGLFLYDMVEIKTPKRR